MTTISQDGASASVAVRRLGVLRLSATGAAASGLFFILCWAGAVISLTGASHMYIALFTAAPVASTAALLEGLCWSVLFGAVAGVLVAIFYNAFAVFERR